MFSIVSFVKEALSVLMLCAPSNRRRPFRIISYHKKIGINSEKRIEYGK